MDSIDLLSSLKQRFEIEPSLIQVILGPRQVGKTTAVHGFLETHGQPYLYFATEESDYSSLWIEACWQSAVQKNKDTLLVIDEIQKIEQWSETIKRLWDQQKRFKKTNIKVLLLGSSSLEIQKNLSESLTGRFELIRAYHWTYEESKFFFKIKFNDYIKYGGYPGSYMFLSDLNRFKLFVKNSIIETVIDKDILKFQHVKSPALFRQTFDLLMSYPAQEISYTKLLGQLQDKGNTDLIKSYIKLFESAFLIKEIKKYSKKSHLEKSSSPKIIPLCNSLVSDRYKTDDPELIGRLYESLVGAELVKNFENVYYWRQASYEVDYVIEFGKKLYAIEVKSGRKKNSKGLEYFRQEFKNATLVWINSDNIFEFLKNPKVFFDKIG